MTGRYLWVYLILLLGSFRLFSQEKQTDSITPFARIIVDTLASPYMHGRGYYKNGDKLAAQYIGTQFSGMRIDWKYQDLPFAINTFPKKLSVTLDGVALECGKDFIADASTRSVKGKFLLVWVDSSVAVTLSSSKTFLASDFEGKALVIEHENIFSKEIKDRLLSLARIVKSSLIIFADTKLTHSVSPELDPYPLIHIQKEKISRKNSYISVNIRSKLVNNYSVRNVIAVVPGMFKDSFLVYSAHYDHLGRMGPEVYFPGANDNASGIAMLLAMARHYTKVENRPKYSMVFIAFGGEEIGLVGSRYYVQNPTVPLNKIRFLVNLDILGTGEDGITVVNATQHDREFKQLQKLNAQGDYLSQVKSRGKAANSDHYWFSERGVPSFFIYTMGGIKAYHDVYDKRETLPLTKFNDLFKLLLDFNASFGL